MVPLFMAEVLIVVAHLQPTEVAAVVETVNLAVQAKSLFATSFQPDGTLRRA
jgi:hypothetical protein